MCGIVACVTHGAADAYLLQALAALEYRGYDSAGIAVRTVAGDTFRVRAAARVGQLATRVRREPRLDLTGVGIGHTRWATHGGVTEINAHPHVDCDGRLSVVHNGIIDNADELRAEVELFGHTVVSEVDSEVIPHLIEHEIRHGVDLTDAVRTVAARLHGSWAIVVMDAETGRVVGTARRAPLVVARSVRGSFFASDVAALAPWIDEYRVLGDGDVVELRADPDWGATAVPDAIALHADLRDTGLRGHTDYMHKEIAEQPELAATILDALAADAVSGRLWRDLDLGPFARVAILGCGTSLNAGAVVARAFRRFGGVPAAEVVASEGGEAVLDDDTLVLALSQSGETADLLAALETAAFTDRPLLALTNNPHSSLARRSAAIIPCGAGREVGVAATKTFVAQVLTGTLHAIAALVVADRLSPERAESIVDDLKRMPDLLAQALAVSTDRIPALAEELRDASGFLYLGRGGGVTYAAEGALKLKELTYRWAEHYPAGELKHGPLALVEQGTPTIVIDSGDARLAGNIAEVAARGGRIVRIGGAASEIPALGLSVGAPRADGFAVCGPLESVIPLQVLAREVALALGRDVDKPRNLAKSVTVE